MRIPQELIEVYERREPTGLYNRCDGWARFPLVETMLRKGNSMIGKRRILVFQVEARLSQLLQRLLSEW